MTTVAQNLFRVEERIKNAAIRCGRNVAEIRLVAVTKKIAPEKIREAIQAGAFVLGENYVQEARKKIELFGKEPQWHFIGHLQSNKVKYAVDLFDMIHSVDRLSLAEELDKEARKRDKNLPILIQVNISGEDTKSGINPDETITLIKKISCLGNLKIQGLMTMPPWFPNPEDARPYFRALKRLQQELESEKLERVSLGELSMGMSADFEVAIEEGATLVRVGTAIFGPRD
jgi:pyridoxal phosphate enzyme (YggS family)